MSAYYAAPDGPTAVTSQEELAPVLVAFTGPAPQSRLTVLIRLLMVIPHFVVLWALGIAAYVLVIIGWFGALFTGRLPNFAADYLAGFVRWQTRVFGYTILLTDVYPPFTLEDADYPIRVAVRPGQLNRLAVLFRLFLLIPAWIVESVVAYGAFTLFQIVNWLIVLISGRMPDALYQALAAALRYQARVIGFAFMLTSAYPSGLYGDPVAAVATVPAGPQPEYGAFEAQPGYGQQPEYGPQPGHGQQPGYGTPTVATGVASWWLVLSSRARTLVTVFIVLGVLFAAGEAALEATVTSNAVTSTQAASQLQSDLNRLNRALITDSARMQSCHTTSCASGPNTTAAAAFNTFGAQVRAIPMPSGQASADAANLAASASHTASVFSALAAATTTTQYNSIVASRRQAALNQVQHDYTTLINELTGS